MAVDGREIVIGVTGGIAAYKTAALVSRLAQAGAGVSVVMTPSAEKFAIALLSLKTKPPEVMKSHGACTMCACATIGVDMPAMAAAIEPASARAEKDLRDMVRLLRMWMTHRRQLTQNVAHGRLGHPTQEEGKLAASIDSAV